MQRFVAMSDDATRTLWSRESGGRLDVSFLKGRRRARSHGAPEPKREPQPQPQPQAKADPTSWNGISYDDMMRTLADALPESERPTLVGKLPDTQPAPFMPVEVTQRMMAAPQKHVVYMHTQPLTSIAPVAMPSTPPRPAVDADVDVVPVARPRRGKIFSIGAALGALIAVGAFASSAPEARASAKSAAMDARAHVSGWVSRVTAESAKPSSAPAAAPPPVVVEPAPSVPPAGAAGATVDAPPPVPQMRAPTPPPPRRVVTKNTQTSSSDDDEAAGAVVEPGSLLDHGLEE